MRKKKKDFSGLDEIKSSEETEKLIICVNEAIASDGNTSNLNFLDTNNSTDMSSLFKGYVNFNGEICKWNTNKVTSINNMCNGATSFNQDLRHWNNDANPKTTGMCYRATAREAANKASWMPQQICHSRYATPDISMNSHKYTSLKSEVQQKQKQKQKKARRETHVKRL